LRLSADQDFGRVKRETGNGINACGLRKRKGTSKSEDCHKKGCAEEKTVVQLSLRSKNEGIRGGDRTEAGERGSRVRKDKLKETYGGARVAKRYWGQVASDKRNEKSIQEDLLRNLQRTVPSLSKNPEAPKTSRKKGKQTKKLCR